jgi:hypothetical protein
MMAILRKLMGADSRNKNAARRVHAHAHRSVSKCFKVSKNSATTMMVAVHRVPRRETLINVCAECLLALIVYVQICPKAALS